MASLSSMHCVGSSMIVGYLIAIFCAAKYFVRVCVDYIIMSFVDSFRRYLGGDLNYMKAA